jgi:hypothetical protein
MKLAYVPFALRAAAAAPWRPHDGHTPGSWRRQMPALHVARLDDVGSLNAVTRTLVILARPLTLDGLRRAPA